MTSSTPKPRHAPLASAIALLLGACVTEPAATDTFNTTGEVIALSGGDAGAQNACIACHGLRGEGNGHEVPRLAGLDRGYFLHQMELFGEGLRRHEQMHAIAQALDWDARQKLAAYYSQLPIPARTEPPADANCADHAARLYHAGAPDRAIPACAECHGPDGTGLGHGNPALVAQPAPYIAEQLRNWRDGKRYGDPNRTMTDLSRRLEPREIADLADYVATLPHATGYPEPREACLPERRRDPRSGA